MKLCAAGIVIQLLHTPKTKAIGGAGKAPAHNPVLYIIPVMQIFA